MQIMKITGLTSVVNGSLAAIRRSKKYLTGFSGKMSTEVKCYVLDLLPPLEQSEIESGAKKVVMVVQAIFEGK